MTFMRVMQMTINKEVKMIAVRHAFVTTRRTVSMSLLVTLARMIGSAGIRIDIADWKRMFVDMVVVHMVQMPVMQIVSVPVVRHSRVSTAVAMRVSVAAMLFACVFHKSRPPLIVRN